jgi:Beta-ketoacyl synthase, N-terminal domain
MSVVPTLPEMPAMIRRRVERSGRLACQVAYWCQAGGEQIPMVFASRHGDAARSLSMLGDLVNQQALSPAGFALSVHNAVSAVYAIARGDKGNAIVVAAGRATVTAALAEASALLADGAPEVLVVCYDAPLPQDYARFHDEEACEFAWAWLVGPAASDAVDAGMRIRLQVEARERQPGADGEGSWPAGLAVLRQFLRQVGGAPLPDSLLHPDRPGVSARWETHV